MIDYFLSDMDGSLGSTKFGEAIRCVKDFFYADVKPLFKVFASIKLVVVFCWIRALFLLRFFLNDY